MEILPTQPERKNIEALPARDLVEMHTQETMEEKDFSRTKDNLTVNIFISKGSKNFFGVVTEPHPEEQNTIRQSVITEEKDLMDALKKTVDDPTVLEGQFQDIKGDNLIISSPKNYILVPESGNLDIARKS